MLGPLWAERVQVREHWPMVFLAACGAMCLGCIVLEILPQIEHPSASSASPFAAPAIGRELRHALWLNCAGTTIFWLAAQQAGSSLVLFTELHTAHHVTTLCRTWSGRAGHFASLHGLLVLALLPLFVKGMRWLRRRGAAPSAPMKMLRGYFALAAAFALFGAVGLQIGDGNRAHPAWLASGYLILSIAEISIGPIGLSLVTQLAPIGKKSQSIALWFAAMAVGNLLARLFGLLWGPRPAHRYFGCVALMALGVAGGLRACSGRLGHAVFAAKFFD